jgi:hypothetical protein
VNVRCDKLSDVQVIIKGRLLLCYSTSPGHIYMRVRHKLAELCVVDEDSGVGLAGNPNDCGSVY